MFVFSHRGPLTCRRVGLAQERMGCFHCGEGLVKGNFEIEKEDDRNVKISLSLAAYASGYFSVTLALCR